MVYLIWIGENVLNYCLGSDFVNGDGGSYFGLGFLFIFE